MPKKLCVLDRNVKNSALASFWKLFWRNRIWRALGTIISTSSPITTRRNTHSCALSAGFHHRQCLPTIAADAELAASHRENYGFFGGEACAVGAGVTLPDGRTPAPESGAAEGWAVVCCFNNSRRSPVSLLVLCEYKIDKVKVSAKKIPANQAVNLTSTLVVCAPKIFSVTPPPKAAPSPSLFGRCIKMTSNIRSATRT